MLGVLGMIYLRGGIDRHLGAEYTRALFSAFRARCRQLAASKLGQAEQEVVCGRFLLEDLRLRLRPALSVLVFVTGKSKLQRSGQPSDTRWVVDIGCWEGVDGETTYVRDEKQAGERMTAILRKRTWFRSLELEILAACFSSFRGRLRSVFSPSCLCGMHRVSFSVVRAVDMDMESCALARSFR